MECEMVYCIYNKEFFCILKETQLNSLGMCEECIIVLIPDDILEELKDKGTLGHTIDYAYQNNH